MHKGESPLVCEARVHCAVLKLVSVVLCRDVVDSVAALLVPAGFWRPTWIQDVVLTFATCSTSRCVKRGGGGGHHWLCILLRKSRIALAAATGTESTTRTNLAGDGA